MTSLFQSRRWVRPSAFVVILLSGTALGSYYFRGSTYLRGARSPEITSPGSAAPARPSVRIEQETVNAPTATPDLLGGAPVLPFLPPTVPPALPPPIADGGLAPGDASVVRAVNLDAPPPAVVPETPRSEVRLDQLPRAPLPKPPAKPVTAASDMSAALEPSATTGAVVPAAKSEPTPIDESSSVRSVLTRFERAYSSLDADAASAVWPGVDRSALARAFHGLASQHVSLHSCDVTVTGAAAYAQCSGTATWVPKVGGGARTAARQWNFELRKREGDWEIERAVAR